MVTPRQIVTLCNQRMGLVLDVAESALPPTQYEAFRRIVLNQFGRDGFEADLDRLFSGGASGAERNGPGRN